MASLTFLVNTVARSEAPTKRATLPRASSNSWVASSARVWTPRCTLALWRR